MAKNEESTKKDNEEPNKTQEISLSKAEKVEYTFFAQKKNSKEKNIK
jgi:hypothetical protein